MTVEIGFLVFATLFLAYSNGANDNFKGVATLFGSGTTSYKKALAWATGTTLAGSITSIFLAQALLKTFSGKGLVPPAIAGAPEFLLAAAVGGGLTVMLATLTGFPVSTTHALTGALVGAGLTAIGADVRFAVLGKKFFLPLMVSPLLAVLLGFVLYPMLRLARIACGVKKELCVCVGEAESIVPIPQPVISLSLSAVREILPSVGTVDSCEQRYAGRFVGLRSQAVLDSAHFASAGMVGFARGLNDTPKIVALLLGVQALGVRSGMALVAIAMALGGILNAKQVAAPMSLKITKLNHGQGFAANLITAFLVIFASRMGVPVSTTHVSVGSLFGIGAVTGQADARVVRNILLSWVLTLPVGALLSAAIYAAASGQGTPPPRLPGAFSCLFLAGARPNGSGSKRGDPSFR